MGRQNAARLMNCRRGGSARMCLGEMMSMFETRVQKCMERVMQRKGLVGITIKNKATFSDMGSTTNLTF